MAQEFYSLQRIVNGKHLFISKNNMNELTDNPNEALAFFSENHINVWKTCNPTFKDANIVKMIKENGTISIKK